MADFISRQAAINIVCHDDCEGCPDGGCDMYRRMKRLPAADAVEVVRCKDCINWNGNDCITMHGLSAPRPDDYCSRGEKNSG